MQNVPRPPHRTANRHVRHLDFLHPLQQKRWERLRGMNLAPHSSQRLGLRPWSHQEPSSEPTPISSVSIPMERTPSP